MSPSRAARLLAISLCITMAAVACRSSTDRSETPSATYPPFWSRLLSESEAIGPAREPSVSVLVDLRSSLRPTLLLRWASARGLTVSWGDGASWAGLSGSPTALGRAFDTQVLDYRAPTGREFYAAVPAAVVPAELSSEVSAIGRIGTFRLAHPIVKYVPPGGLTTSGLVQAYGAAPLRQAGYDGHGQTIVFLEWSPPNQGDLDRFTGDQALPPLHPDLEGENGPSQFSDAPKDLGAASETNMDVEVAHAIAPGATIVVFDANPSLEDGAMGIATLFQDVARAFPGAIWSSSIGWGCDQAFAWPDLKAVDGALAQAETKGTTAFDASGDTSGLECKENLREAFDTPPGPQDVGVDGLASLPSMTSVGGTTLSVSTQGTWFGEATWDESALANGTGGGVSTVIPKPPWQQGPGVGGDLSAAEAGFREVPDVSADADPLTGVKIFDQGAPGQGGGTSQSAPIWAGLTALMNQYLETNHGHAIGALNPIVYQLARSPQPYPPFHDVSLGGNAVHLAGVGYDMATGVGTPDAYKLVLDIMRYQEGGH